MVTLHKSVNFMHHSDIIYIIGQHTIHCFAYTSTTCINGCIEGVFYCLLSLSDSYYLVPFSVARLHRMEEYTPTWLDAITADSARTIAKATGLSHTTISRAAGNPTPPPAVVVAVARAYGYNPVEALSRTGLLTPLEARPVTGEASLRRVSTRVLLQELLRREAEDSQD